MWLLTVALFGLLVPNGFFVYWLLFEFHGIMPALQDKLALGFILDVVVTLIVLSVYFARHPIGRVKWHWFVSSVLSRGTRLQPAIVLLAQSASEHAAGRAANGNIRILAHRPAQLTDPWAAPPLPNPEPRGPHEEAVDLVARAAQTRSE
jgi:hypothetical protein